MQISFQVDGEPVAQPRHKISGRKRWIKKLSDGSDHPIHVYREAVLFAARQAMGKNPPMKGPLYLEVLFLFKGNKTPQRTWRDKLPDCDNLVKGLKDAIRLRSAVAGLKASLTGVIWENDLQIVSEHIDKMNGCDGECPKTIVLVKQLPPCESF